MAYFKMPYNFHTPTENNCKCLYLEISGDQLIFKSVTSKRFLQNSCSRFSWIAKLLRLSKANSNVHRLPIKPQTLAILLYLLFRLYRKISELWFFWRKSTPHSNHFTMSRLLVKHMLVLCT